MIEVRRAEGRLAFFRKRSEDALSERRSIRRRFRFCRSFGCGRFAVSVCQAIRGGFGGCLGTVRSMRPSIVALGTAVSQRWLAWVMASILESLWSTVAKFDPQSYRFPSSSCDCGHFGTVGRFGGSVCGQWQHWTLWHAFGWCGERRF